MMPELKLKDCVDHRLGGRADCFFQTDEKRTTLDSPYCWVTRTAAKNAPDAVRRGWRRIGYRPRSGRAVVVREHRRRHPARRLDARIRRRGGRCAPHRSSTAPRFESCILRSRQGTGTGPPPTFQVAYGIYGLVEEASLAPYAADAMLLFDYAATTFLGERGDLRRRSCTRCRSTSTKARACGPSSSRRPRRPPRAAAQGTGAADLPAVGTPRASN